MRRNRVAMRRIREILRLAWDCGQTRQAIADTCGIDKTTVTDTLYRASAANLCCSLPAATLMTSGWKASSILLIPYHH